MISWYIDETIHVVLIWPGPPSFLSFGITFFRVSQNISASIFKKIGTAINFLTLNNYSQEGNTFLSEILLKDKKFNNTKTKLVHIRFQYIPDTVITTKHGLKRSENTMTIRKGNKTLHFDDSVFPRVINPKGINWKFLEKKMYENNPKCSSVWIWNSKQFSVKTLCFIIDE